jgi:hypothetical protein
LEEVDNEAIEEDIQYVAVEEEEGEQVKKMQMKGWRKRQLKKNTYADEEEAGEE